MRVLARTATGVVALACVLLTYGSAPAHALHAQAKLDRGKLVVEAKFDGDEPAENAKVYVVAENGAKTLRGRTDRDGRLLIHLPPPGTYEIQVDAGAGHLAKVKITMTAEMQSGPSPSPEPILLADGRSIEEAQRHRWLKVTMGLVAILAFAAILKVCVRRRDKQPSSGE